MNLSPRAQNAYFEAQVALARTTLGSTGAAISFALSLANNPYMTPPRRREPPLTITSPLLEPLDFEMTPSTAASSPPPLTPPTYPRYNNDVEMTPMADRSSTSPTSPPRIIPSTSVVAAAISAGQFDNQSIGGKGKNIRCLNYEFRVHEKGSRVSLMIFV